MFFCWGGGKIILLKNLNKYKIIPCINITTIIEYPSYISSPPPFHMFDAIHVVTQIRLKLIS